MLKRKTYFKAIFVLPFLLQISLLSINFQSNFDLNNPNYSIMNHDITTICQMGKFDIDKNEKNTLKLIESKEISVIPELENIFCLGKVVEVSFTTSRVLLLSDLNSKVPVDIMPNNIQSILSGTGDNEGVIQYTRQQDLIEENAIAFTSGAGGLFKSGIPIGKIFKDSSNNKTLVSFFLIFLNLDM